MISKTNIIITNVSNLAEKKSSTTQRGPLQVYIFARPLNTFSLSVQSASNAKPRLSTAQLKVKQKETEF